MLLPSLSELKATMSWTNTGSPDDVKLLPLVPEAALKTLHGVRADGSEAALATTGTWQMAHSAFGLMLTMKMHPQ